MNKNLSLMTDYSISAKETHTEVKFQESKQKRKSQQLPWKKNKNLSTGKAISNCYQNFYQ